MKNFILIVIFSFFSLNIFAKSVDVEVHGMVCEFCTSTIQKNLYKNDAVENVKIDFDTKNVTIDYLENRIIGEYLDFSFERNSMIISREVVYTNPENTLKADVIEVDIKSKDTKIFMFDNQKKVNIKSKN